MLHVCPASLEASVSKESPNRDDAAEGGCVERVAKAGDERAVTEHEKV
jgi:hypothetical protein